METQSDWFDRGTATGCVVCGRGPTARLRLRRVTGMLNVFRWSSLDAPYCRLDGPAAARRWLGLTIALGPWGVLSLFLASPVAIVYDIVALIRALRLPHPMGRPAPGTVAAKVAEAAVIAELVRRYREAGDDKERVLRAWAELSPKLDPYTRDEVYRMLGGNELQVDDGVGTEVQRPARLPVPPRTDLVEPRPRQRIPRDGANDAPKPGGRKRRVAGYRSTFPPSPPRRSGQAGNG